ncbi:MAG: plasmid pRiA4b ORF-3 family protein [Dermatophilaceae bacterium]
MSETPGFPRNREIALPEPPEGPLLLTVRVDLRDTSPPVWRRLTIPGELDLGKFHDVLQVAMGWTDSHLHRFLLGGDRRTQLYFLCDFDLEEGEEGTHESDARLDQVLGTPGDKIDYDYDFGDGWSHVIRLEEIVPRPASEGPAGTGSAAYPSVCLAGKRACPPEDVGGIGGYEEAAAWVRGGSSATHEFDNGLTGEEMGDWLPEGWHPDDFDLGEVNAMLARLAPGDTDTALSHVPGDLVELIGRLPTLARTDVNEWLGAPGWDAPATFTAEVATALTTPVRAVLDVVGDGLTLTAAGYLPPRAVQAVFGAADMGEDWIGKGNREDLTPPVAVLRDQVRHLGLIRKTKGRLVPTALGRRVRDNHTELLGVVLTRLGQADSDFGRLATGLTFLALAGGVPITGLWGAGEAIEERVCRVLSIVGWHVDGGGAIGRREVRDATMDPVQLLRQMVRTLEDAEAARAVRDVARAVLDRMN